MRPFSTTDNIRLAFPPLTLIKQTPEKNDIFLYRLHFTVTFLQMLHSLNHRDDLFISFYFDALKSVHAKTLL